MSILFLTPLFGCDKEKAVPIVSHKNETIIAYKYVKEYGIVEGVNASYVVYGKLKINGITIRAGYCFGTIYPYLDRFSIKEFVQEHPELMCKQVQIAIDHQRI